MSLRLEMLQVARLAPSLLGESVSLVVSFLQSRQVSDGGFCGRDGTSDLYYSSFAIDGLMACQEAIDESRLRDYLVGFGEGEGLDFVHLCCLLRLWSVLPQEIGESRLAALLQRVESFRTKDGGYEGNPGALAGSCYGCFLAYGAYSDHGKEVPHEEGVAACLDSLQVAGGAWSNDTLIRVGAVPAVAAAVTLARNFRRPIPLETASWLLSCWSPEGGGFRAIQPAPMPDLLSTAVALHAMDSLQAPLDGIREQCLDFVDSLWTNAGGFHGTWDDDELDVEYTYYGLLALGHLSL